METKILVIGDLHGLNVWKKMIINPVDKIIFLWDYVDSFTVPDADIIQNLKDIIKFKKKNPEMVELLLGNHDIQYIYKGNNCSWKRKSYEIILENLYKNNLDLFKICHEEWEYLFSHAGFTQKWEELVYEKLNENVFELTSYDSYNDMLHTRYRKLLFMVWTSRGGHHAFGWPLWADRSETEETKMKNRIQVVWHTPVKKILNLWHIVYCDNIEHGNWAPIILTTQ